MKDRPVPEKALLIKILNMEPGYEKERMTFYKGYIQSASWVSLFSGFGDDSEYFVEDLEDELNIALVSAVPTLATTLYKRNKTMNEFNC